MRCLGSVKMLDEATLKKAYRKVAKKYHPDMNPGDAEAEKKFKKLRRHMLYLVTRKNDSMISLVMRHLKAEQEEPADMADLTLMVLILAIYSGYIWRSVWRRPQRRPCKSGTNERYEHPKECASPLKRLYLDVRKN